MVNIVFPRDRQERWVPPNTHTGKIIAYEKKAHLQKAELKFKKKNYKKICCFFRKKSFSEYSSGKEIELLQHCLSND